MGYEVDMDVGVGGITVPPIKVEPIYDFIQLNRSQIEKQMDIILCWELVPIKNTGHPNINYRFTFVPPPFTYKIGRPIDHVYVLMMLINYFRIGTDPYEELLAAEGMIMTDDRIYFKIQIFNGVLEMVETSPNFEMDIEYTIVKDLDKIKWINRKLTNQSSLIIKHTNIVLEDTEPA